MRSRNGYAYAVCKHLKNHVHFWFKKERDMNGKKEGEQIISLFSQNATFCATKKERERGKNTSFFFSSAFSFNIGSLCSFRFWRRRRREETRYLSLRNRLCTLLASQHVTSTVQRRVWVHLYYCTPDQKQIHKRYVVQKQGWPLKNTHKNILYFKK